MKRARSILFAVALAAVLLAWMIWWLQPEPLSIGELTLPDGTMARIVSVTYGTNHECGTFLGRHARWLPPRIQNYLTSFVGHRALAWSGWITTSPEYKVWIERTTNQPPPLNPPSRIWGILEDENGEISGKISGLWPFGRILEPFSFEALPRRSPRIKLHFIASYPNSFTNLGSLSFRNPYYVATNYPNWTPTSLPATNQAGDLEVVISELTKAQGWNTVERRMNGERELKLRPGHDEHRTKYVVVAPIRSVEVTNQSWMVNSVILSDATGNRLTTRTRTHWLDPDEAWFEFEGALWTAEPAWKMDLELTRRSGFSESELVTFRSVPLGQVGQSNVLGWTSNLLGGSITLNSFLRRHPHDEDVYNTIKTHGSIAEFSMLFPSNTHFRLVGMTLPDGGTNFWLRISGWERMEGLGNSPLQQTLAFQNIPVDAATADITFSVQTSRWVQFTVKPTFGKTRIPLPPAPVRHSAGGTK